ncbi:MAG: lysine-sensitive aspartokinase 3, partial [Proteobacteria bacterium]
MSTRTNVAKFGGTSMGSAEAMRAAAKIVAKEPSVGLVVVSATSGSTNQLLQIYRAAA